MRNIWKRSLSLLLAMVMVLSAVPMGALAEEVVEEEFFEEETSCDHASYEDTDYVSPDCTTAGYIEYTCPDCGETWTEEIDAVGHDYVDGVCTSCGAVAPEDQPEEICEDAEDHGISTQAAVSSDNVLDFDEVSEDATVGLILLDADATTVLSSCLTEPGKLTKLVLDAIGYEGDRSKVTVKFNGNDISNIIGLAGAYTDFKSALQDHKTLKFQLVEGTESKDIYIICRNVGGISIEVSQMTIQNPGEPSTLATDVADVLNSATIKISHNNNDLTKWAIQKASYSVSKKSSTAFVWPEAGEETTVSDAITVTIWDDLNTKKVTRNGSLTLKDTTPIYTVTYMSNGTQVAQYRIAENGATIQPDEDPVRKYYTFAGWQKANTQKLEVDATVTGNVTYNAFWTPELDLTGPGKTEPDGIADQEQKFQVTFDYNYPEDAATTGATSAVKNILWGTVISNAAEKPADPTCEGYVFTGWQGGNAKVTGDVKVKAQWQKATEQEPYTVVYHLRYGQSFKLSTQNGKAIDPNAGLKWQKGDYVIWDAWYTDADFTTKYEKFDEQVELGEGETELHLYGRWFDDDNNNGKADGSDADPCVTYHFYLKEQGAEDNAPDTTLKKWPMTDADKDYNPEKEKGYQPSEGDKFIFDHWNIVTEDEGNDKTVHCYPVYTPDVNMNRVADKDEMAQLIFVGDDSVAQENVTITVDGISVYEEDGDTYILRNSKEDSELKVVLANDSMVVSKIALVPNTVSTGLYDEDAVVGEIKLDMTYDGQTITATIPADTETTTISGNYDLSIYIRDARQLVLKNTQDPLDQSSKSEEAVYKALVSAPEYDATAVAIEYKARDEVKGGMVSAQKLYDAVKPYESVVPGAWDLLQGWLGLKEESGAWYYYYDLDEKWMDIEADGVSNVVRTPQEIVDTYITQVAAEVDITNPNELISQLGSMKKELEDQLATANIHPFGYNPDGANEVTEYVNITYQQEHWTLKEENVPVKLKDSREANSLTVTSPDLSFAYGQVTMGKIRENLELEKGSKSDIQFNVVLEGKGVGTYRVVATYPGNDQYKQCTVSFDVTITKAKVSITMNKLYVAQERFSFKDVEANAGGAAVLQVIAGWDVTEGELNLAAPVVSGLNGKAWVVAPEGMQELVELALEKLGYGTEESISLSQFTSLVNKHRDVLETRLSATNVSRLISFLNKVSTYVDAEMDIVFGKPENVNTGIYLNLAVLADPNYEGSVEVTDPKVDSNTEFAYGGIVVSPVIAVPNLGGVQLVRTATGKAENIFAFGRDETVALDVTLNGVKVDSKIHYYGVTGAAAVYNDTVAPTASGLYVAATVYYSADGSKIGSDSAIVLVGKYEADMTIYNTVVAQEGDKTFAPTYDVTRKDANKTKGNPDIIMISGEVTKANDSDKLDLELLKGDVYVDVPQWLGNLWETFVTSQAGQSLGLTADDAKNPVISKKALTGFLDWCIKQVEKTDNAVGKAVDKLNSLGVNNALTGKIDNIPDWLTNNLQKALEQANKLPDGDKVIHIHTYTSADKTGNNHITHYGAVGVYYYVGIIADSDYLPAVTAGGLVITEEEDALVLWDTEVPYDGEGHEPIAADEDAMATAMTVIREEDGKLTILLDETLMKDLGLEANSNLTLNQLISDKGDKGQTKVDQIIDKMAAVAKKKLEADKVDKVDEKVKDLSEKLKDKMVKKLQALAGDATGGNNTRSFTVQSLNNLPSAIGTYQFYTFTYGMSYATAKLTIHPWYVDITANNAKKLYGEVNPDFTATLEFYSYQTSRKNGGVVTDRIVDKDKDSAGLKYTISRTSTDENVGTYTGDLKVTVTEKGNFQVGTLVDGDFTIEAKEITVKPDKDFEKYYGDADPEMSASVTLDNGTKITINMKHNGVNAQEEGYPLYQDGEPTFELVGDDIADNYTVKFDADGKTMKIKPAEITVNIKDQELNVDNTVGDLATILSNRSDLDNLPYEKATEGNKGDVDLSDITIELAVENLSLADVNETLTPGKYNIYCKSYTKSDNYTITFTPGELTVGLHTEEGDYICWNVDTEVYYTSVNTALKEAKGKGQTIQMLADASADDFMVYSGLTLDLNGYYITTDYVTAFGVVMDSEPTADEANAFESTVSDGNVKSGGIVIDSESVYLAENNGGYLPIYDTVTGSYKFFEGEMKNYKTKVLDGGVKFRFDLSFENMEGYKVLAGTDNSCLNVLLNITWPGIDNMNVGGINYRMEDTLVHTYASGCYDALLVNEPNNMPLMFVNVNGLKNIASGSLITGRPKFVSNTNVATEESANMEYIVP